MEPYKVKLGDELIVDTLPNDLERINYIMEHSEADVKNVGVIEVTKFVLLECVDFVAVTMFDEAKEPMEFTTHYHHNVYWADWLVGEAPEEDEKRQRALKENNKKLGKFIVKYGWRPDLHIIFRPDNETVQRFINKEQRELDKTDTIPDYYLD